MNNQLINYERYVHTRVYAIDACAHALIARPETRALAREFRRSYSVSSMDSKETSSSANRCQQWTIAKTTATSAIRMSLQPNGLRRKIKARGRDAREEREEREEREKRETTGVREPRRRKGRGDDASEYVPRSTWCCELARSGRARIATLEQTVFVFANFARMRARRVPCAILWDCTAAS